MTTLMTTTPLNYFDKTPGTIEQLVLGVITQKLINRDYIHESLATDFTTNAITYGVTVDSGDNLEFNGNLAISLTFPTVPFERQILTDKPSFDLRILSLNSLNIDTLSLPQKPDYPLASFSAQLPAYLSLPVPENTLERRLLALCLHIRNYLNWIDRWNNVANYWIMTVVNNLPYNTYPLAEIELDRDNLLLELQNGVTYQAIPVEKTYIPSPQTPPSNPGTAQELIGFFQGSEGSDSSDPGSLGSPISSSLMNDLQDAASDNSGSGSGGFGGNQPDQSKQSEPEKPTLPNC